MLKAWVLALTLFAGQAEAIEDFPILDSLNSKASALHPETIKWMGKWRHLDLEQTDDFIFDELSGSTSINLKIKKIDPLETKGYQSLGGFVPRNSSANPNAEIAYFNLAAIFGVDRLIRPTVPYILEEAASFEFKSLIEKTQMQGKWKLHNREKILAAINSGKPLKGCLKAKKPDSAVDVRELRASNALNLNHPLVQLLQANNRKPVAGNILKLNSMLAGDEQALAREFSILLTFDAVFGQWDRYSGGNIGVRKDEQGSTHFYFTDNGGADLSSSTLWVEKQLSWFSRYDYELIQKLKELRNFLHNPALGYHGYTRAEDFIHDLGLYFELPTTVYAVRLTRNIDLVLKRVEEVESLYGVDAYF